MRSLNSRAAALAAAVFAVASLACARASHAQAWVVDAAAGATDYEALSDVATRSAMLGIRREGAPWLYLTAGLPLDSEGLPWGAAGAAFRPARGLAAALGGLELGADLGVHGYGYREPVLDASGGGVTVEAVPWAALSRGAARLELRGGWLHHTAIFDGASEGRDLFDTGARFRWAPDARLALGVEARYAVAAEGGYPFAGASAEWTGERTAAWARAGRWLSDVVERPAWAAGGSVATGAGFRLFGEVEQSTNDPLYWSTPRRSWRLGLSRALGAAPSARLPALPLSAPLLPETRSGHVVFRLPLDAAAAGAPAVAGDFNDWQPVELRRTPRGWEASLAIAPGVYHYGFRRADGSWFVPAGLPRVDDGMGGESAVLVVPGA